MKIAQAPSRYSLAQKISREERNHARQKSGSFLTAPANEKKETDRAGDSRCDEPPASLRNVQKAGAAPHSFGCAEKQEKQRDTKKYDAQRERSIARLSFAVRLGITHKQRMRDNETTQRVWRKKFHGLTQIPTYRQLLRRSGAATRERPTWARRRARTKYSPKSVARQNSTALSGQVPQRLLVNRLG